jgi:hypothetical protein
MHGEAQKHMSNTPMKAIEDTAMNSFDSADVNWAPCPTYLYMLPHMMCGNQEVS